VAKLLLYLFNPDKYQYQQNRIEWCFDEWSITMHAGRAHYACWRRCGLPYQYHIQMKLSRSRALDALKTHRRKMPMYCAKPAVLFVGIAALGTKR